MKQWLISMRHQVADIDSALCTSGKAQGKVNVHWERKHGCEKCKQAHCLTCVRKSRPRFIIKTPPYRDMTHILNIKRSRNRLIFNMGIPYLERQFLYWNGPNCRQILGNFVYLYILIKIYSVFVCIKENYTVYGMYANNGILINPCIVYWQKYVKCVLLYGEPLETIKCVIESVVYLITVWCYWKPFETRYIFVSATSNPNCKTAVLHALPSK